MIRGAIVDLDGTVYTGDTLVPGAKRGLDDLRSADVSPLFFSNNPTRDGEAYVERLVAMGLDVRSGEACSAADVTVAYLQTEHPDETTYLVGSRALGSILRENGVAVVDDPVTADVLVASWTDEFSYGDMQAALDGLDESTTFLGTDPDRTYPGEGGRLVPGTGAITSALAATVGREPDRVLGKPSTEALSVALERIGVPPEDCLVVGDRLNTDLAMGARAGMTTALVLTGVSDHADVEASDVEPDYVLDSLAEVGRIVGR